MIYCDQFCTDSTHMHDCSASYALFTLSPLMHIILTTIIINNIARNAARNINPVNMTAMLLVEEKITPDNNRSGRAIHLCPSPPNAPKCLSAVRTRCMLCCGVDLGFSFVLLVLPYSMHECQPFKFVGPSKKTLLTPTARRAVAYLSIFSIWG